MLSISALIVDIKDDAEFMAFIPSSGTMFRDEVGCCVVDIVEERALILLGAKEKAGLNNSIISGMMSVLQRDDFMVIGATDVQNDFDFDSCKKRYDYELC